jgi:hypothetical protein
MASELSDVDSRMLTAGGVTAANLPHDLRKLRRSSPPSGNSGFVSTMG